MLSFCGKRKSNALIVNDSLKKTRLNNEEGKQVDMGEVAALPITMIFLA